MANKIDGVDHRGIGIYIIRPSVAEPQPKTKIHHGGTKTRRKSKPSCRWFSLINA